MRKIIAIALLMTFSTSVIAQVYRCESDDGRMQFQSTPCQGRPSEKVDIYVPPAPERDMEEVIEPEGESVFEIRRRERTEAEDRLRARSKAITEERMRQERFSDLIRGNRIAIGMSKDQVRRSWGSPCRVNRTVSTSGNREQWVYCGANYRDDYVYFQGDEVTSISN